MTVPTRTFDDIVFDYQRQGLSNDQITQALEKRGIVIDDLPDDPGEQRFPVTIAEYIQASEGDNLPMDLYQRGILNAAKLTDDQFGLALPTMRQDINEADEILIRDHVQNLAQGKYDGWEWDPELKSKERAKQATRTILKGVAPTADMDRIETWVENYTMNKEPRVQGEMFSNYPLPELSPEEEELALKLYDSRKALKSYGGFSGYTGTSIGAITGLADMLGFRPKAAEEEGVVAYLRDKAARGIAYGLLNQPSDLDEQKRLKDLPQYRNLMNATRMRRREALNELADITGRDEGFDEDYETLQQIFGKVDKSGKVVKKGYFRPANEQQKKLLKDIQNTFRVEDRLNNENTYKDFTTWLDTALEGTGFEINHIEKARKSREALQLEQMKRLETSPRLHQRAIAELLDMVQGLFSLTSVIVNPSKSAQIDNLADLVAAGKLDQDEAKLLMSQKGFQAGSSLFGGLAGWLGNFTDLESFELQAKNEPIGTVLALIPVMKAFEMAKVAGATRGLNRLKKMAEKAGFTDDQILEIANRADDIMTKQQRGMLENWLETARGKNENSKFLAAMDRFGLARGAIGGLKGAGIGLALGGEGDALVLGAISGGLSTTRGVMLASARAERFLDDVTATTSAAGDSVTNNTSEMLGRAQAMRTSLEVALDDARRSGRDLTREDLEASYDAQGAADKLAELEALAESRVAEFREAYEAAPIGSAEKAEARTAWITAKNAATNELVESGEFGSIIPVTRYDDPMNQIYDDLNQRKKELAVEREKIQQDAEAQKREEVETLDRKQNAAALKEAENEMLTARAEVTRAESDAKTLRDSAQKRYDDDYDKVMDQVTQKRRMKARGTKLTRPEEFVESGVEVGRRERDVDAAQKEFDDALERFEGTLPRVLETTGLTLDEWLKKNRRHPVAAANIKLRKAKNALEKAKKRQAKAEQEFENPGVQFSISASTGKLIKGKSKPYAELISELEQRKNKDMLKADAADLRVSEKRAKLELAIARKSELELRQGRDIPDDEVLRIANEENISRKIDSAAEKSLAEIDLAEQRLEETVRRVADAVVRAKKAEYLRAIKATFGFHVHDGPYALKIDTPVTYGRNIVTESGEVVGGTRKITPLSAGDFDLGDFVRMPNGYLGTAQAMDLSTGNLLMAINSFPAENVPGIVRAINNMVDANFETIAGARLPDARLDLTQIRNALKKYDGKKPLKTTKENEAWTRGLIDAMGGSVGARGVNDLKRAQLEVYGDLIINQVNPRLLLNTDTRSRFAKYVLETVHPQLKKIYGEATTKGQAKIELRELEQEINNMVRDFAQTRSLGGDTTVGRPNYKFSRQVEVPNPEDANAPLRQIETLQYDGPRGRRDLDIENLFEDFAESEMTAPQIARARQHAMRDTLYYTQRAMEGRIALEEATLISSGVSRAVWDKGGKHPEYVQGVYRKFLETGELPAALKIAESNGGFVLSAKQNGVSAQILADLINDPEVNTRGMGFDEAASVIDRQLRNAADPKADRAGDYVRLGADGAPDIPGVSRIGGRPVAEQGVGLTSTHNILQPEHIDDITTQLRTDLEAKESTTTVFMRRDVADSFGWMLGTNKTLQAMDSGTLAQLQSISTLFKWFKTAASIVNPMTNYASNTKTLLINQGLNPAQAYLAPVETAALWARYSAGALKGTALEKRLDRLVETGFTEQSILGAEVDQMNLALVASGRNMTFAQGVEDFFKKGVVPGTGGKRIPGVEELTELQDRLYRRYGDELFKLTDSLLEWGKIEDRLDKLAEGSGITFTDLNTGAGFSNSKVLGTIRKISDDDGNKYAVVMKYGKNRNKVIRVKSLDDPAAGTLIARAAMGHANSLYYDLSKTGAGIKMAKRFEALAIMPFTSWRTKALDIPMVKKGMFYRMFVDDNYMMSDDVMTNMRIYGEEAGRAVRRSFWTGISKAGAEDYRELRNFMPSWARRAIFTGNDADISFLLADSSNPIGGLITAFEWMAEADQLIRDGLPEGMIANPTAGDRKFFQLIHGKSSSGVAPTISRVVADLTGGGVLQQIVAAFAGYDTLRNKPFDSVDDYILNLTKTIMPGYAVKLGLPTVATFGAIPTDNYVKQFLDQTKAKVPFDYESMGRRPTQKLMGNTDNFVTGMNVLLARKYRRVDPIWFKNLAKNMVPRLRSMALRETKKLAKEGYTPEDEKAKANVQMIKDLADSYERYAKTIDKALKARD